MIKLIAASLALALGYAFAHRRKTPADPVGDWRGRASERYLRHVRSPALRPRR